MINLQAINNTFTGNRNVVELTKGNFDGTVIYAVPISKEEVADIKQAAKKKTNYKSIPIANMLSIGDPSEPTDVERGTLAFVDTKDMNGRDTKSYYYPPLKRFPTTKDHCIPFESSFVAWNYYAKILLFDTKYKDIVLITVDNS